ncbi:CobW family GTP-binding protein [Brachymonas denitrificans]|uniref:GTPase, G3E family n=1 Tax=Brachymonas denitrificans DSM 15123 TaxID=1121117 RepID=A0A1H8JBH0_9BURK|nr:GTP-binding protein [Brachymonas denitrificans]SEN77537.1 GTPase, G3E family [Brachymonas denitrificans DSM 15123]
MALIPATILTGFLGSGKTTLLKRVLTETHGQKIAVIENEFGEENIDNEILVADTQEQIIQMSNGCVCCTIRDDLRATLQDLAEKRRKGEVDFERVIIETTGMADPGPVAQTFFMDDEVAESYLLDSIITLVDAKHAQHQLDERLEAQRQVGFADQIFISKSDLVGKQELLDLQNRLRAMNPRAPQKVVHFGEVPLKEVLDLRGFNLNAALEIFPEFMATEEHHHHGHAHDCDHAHAEGEACNHHGHKHAEDCDHHHGKDEPCNHHGHHHHAHHHHHDDDVKSFVYRARRPFDPAKLEDLLGAIVQIYGPKMYRYKGVLDMKGTNRKVIFQGVHQLMGSDLGPEWGKDEERESKMVFIGVELPREILEQGLKQCQV